MARVTGNLPVLTRKDVLRILVVVELRRLESVVGMAIAALLAESARVSVLREMAPMAVLRYLVFITASLVAARAGCVGMGAQEREAGFLLVIETRRLPFLRCMA
jgi:hypothetical protein